MKNGLYAGSGRAAKPVQETCRLERKAREARRPLPVPREKPGNDFLNKLLETKKAHLFLVRLSSSLAERTGLEPATSAVTGQHSNQLNYRSNIQTLGAGGC